MSDWNSTIQNNPEMFGGATAEIIQFPTSPDPAEYWVMDGTEEICLMNTLPNARNVARLLAQDWPKLVFTVVDASNKVLFTTGETEH